MENSLSKSSNTLPNREVNSFGILVSCLLVSSVALSHVLLEFKVAARSLSRFFVSLFVVKFSWWKRSQKLVTVPFAAQQEMAIAAIAHVFVFSSKPYHCVPTSVYEEFTAQKAETTLNIEDGEKSAIVEKIETKVEVPGTSVRESVQDIVVEGGQKVVKDVVLTINQAMGPVEKGMTKIQETFHQTSVDDQKEEKQETETMIKEQEENSSGNNRYKRETEIKIEEQEHKLSRDNRSQVSVSRDKTS